MSSLTEISSSPLYRSILETPRLRLRLHTVEDFDACARLWADPRVTQYIGGRPATAEEAWARLLRYRGHWTLLGYGYWVVEERATRAFLGEAGLANFKRQLEPPLGNIPEAGWVLAPEHHGKGYATEAVRAVLHWATEHLHAPSVACLIQQDHAASLRVARRCDFVEHTRTLYKGQPTVVLHHTLQRA